MVKSANTPSSAVSTPLLSKRRKTDDDDMNSLATKKQRTRISFSCGECHRRKQKCDRQIPCSHCVARKVPELCKAYTPGKADQDFNARLTRLEHIIEMALPQYLPQTSSTTPEGRQVSERRRSPSIMEDDNHSLGEEQDTRGGTFQNGKWYGPSASGSIAPASMLQQLHDVVPPSHMLDATSQRQAESNGTSLQRGDRSKMVLEDSAEEDAESLAANNFKSLVHECGVSPHKISELLQELPPLSDSDVLVDYYFTYVNWTRYPVSEKDFRAAYMSVRAHVRDGTTTSNPNTVRFLPLLFVVLAISARLAPEDIAGDAKTRGVKSNRYYWSSRRSLLIAAAIQPDSLEMVLTRLLSARFLTFDRRITECWSQLGAAVRTAQALGFHRDGSTMKMDRPQVEYRRRVWSYLYHADRSYALALGRPIAIQDEYTSTRLPSNIDDESPTAYTKEPLPLTSPTPFTYVILRHQLASIIGRIVHHFQQVRERSHYSEVLTLDDELMKFINNLPPHFALDPNKSLDEKAKYVPVHRFLIVTEVLFIRISLHRPYLLRRSERYAPSRTACFESAMKDYQVRRAFRESVQKEAREALSNAYREFQTAMISGIYCVLEPHGRHANAMHAILDGFVKDHEGTREMDQTTRRELKTVEFLKSKALQAEQADKPSRSAMEESTTGTEQQAQLLLDLQQSATNHNRAFSTGATEVSSPSHQHLGQIQRSPTFQRLHQIPHGDHMNSPMASGSPNTDDENSAQSLLDHWCNTVSNASVDGANGAMSWGGTAGTDFSGWLGTIPASSDTRLLGNFDGSDWNYWEQLVNQIQRAP